MYIPVDALLWIGLSALLGGIFIAAVVHGFKREDAELRRKNPALYT